MLRSEITGRSVPREMRIATKNPASFRDPSGFIFRGEDGVLYRQINRCYQQNYDALIDGGLYRDLVDRGLMIDHEEIALDHAMSADAYRVTRPRELDFISFAYEWSFSALKHAALLTLEIQRRAMDAGMTLKDASHFNVQFEGVRPVFIDTLSFERYESGEPWVAYGQFCRHFLAPLALMANTDVSLGRLLLLHLDGVPLDLASALLPWRTKLHPGLLMHLHLQAKLVRRYSDTSKKRRPMVTRKMQVSRSGLMALMENLTKLIGKLSWKSGGTEWADYYSEHSYDDQGFAEKQRAVSQMLESSTPATVWDLGSNTGVFSRLAADLGAKTYAFDVDPTCVENNYLACRDEDRQNILPLLLDLTNPSPSIGWDHQERQSFASRGPADMVMALALVHHLAISNNVPLEKIVEFFHKMGRWLIVEFVPKRDPQVGRLLRSRKDIFDDYHQTAFEAALEPYFEITRSQPVGTDGRVVYLCEARRR